MIKREGGALVGRKMKYTEEMRARFSPGTFDRIADVLGDTEDRTDFVREAVERELQRREKQKGRADPPTPSNT
jgi:hypothetical protein